MSDSFPCFDSFHSSTSVVVDWRSPGSHSPQSRCPLAKIDPAISGIRVRVSHGGALLLWRQTKTYKSHVDHLEGVDWHESLRRGHDFLQETTMERGQKRVLSWNDHILDGVQGQDGHSTSTPPPPPPGPEKPDRLRRPEWPSFQNAPSSPADKLVSPVTLFNRAFYTGMSLCFSTRHGRMSAGIEHWDQ